MHLLYFHAWPASDTDSRGTSATIAQGLNGTWS